MHARRSTCARIRTTIPSGCSRKVRKIVNDPAIEVAWGQRDVRPSSSSAELDSEAFTAIEAGIKKHYDTVTLPGMSTGATDMAYLRAKGIQCFGVGPATDIEDGPKGFGAHSDQERILESELYRFVKFYYDVVQELAAIELIRRHPTPNTEHAGLRRLLVPERQHRVDARGAVGRDEAGAERHERQQHDRGGRAPADRVPPSDRGWTSPPVRPRRRPASPTAPPISVITATWRSTIARTRFGAAPRAIRSPISRVRWATV